MAATSNNIKNSLLKIGELPQLRIVSTDDLIFHEEPDDDRLLRLVSRLGRDGVLKNPPIVATYNDKGKFVIIDGANRVTALMKLGYRDLAVQIVDLHDPLLALYCWHHAIDRFGRDFFMGHISSMNGVSIHELEEDQKPLPGYLMHLIFRERKPIAVYEEGDILSQIETMNDIADLYIHQPIFDRVSYVNLESLRKHYPNFETLITFREFTKDEFMEIIEAGMKLPAGITRVFLPKRALGLNVPLEILKSELTLSDKNRWLDQYILHMVKNKTIRFYREPTFVFDE